MQPDHRRSSLLAINAEGAAHQLERRCMIRLESIRRGGHERATGESPSVLDLAVHARRQPLGVSRPNAITVTPMLAGIVFRRRQPSCPRSTSAASDRCRQPGHNKAAGPPDSERLRAQARKTPLQRENQAFRELLFGGRETGASGSRSAHQSGNAGGRAIDRPILSSSASTGSIHVVSHVQRCHRVFAERRAPRG